MDDADAQVARRARRGDFDFDALEQDAAGVLRVDPGQDLHHGRLAGAVFATQGVHFAGAQLEVGIVERVHPWKGLLDPFHTHQIDWRGRA